MAQSISAHSSSITRSESLFGPTSSFSRLPDLHEQISVSVVGHFPIGDIEEELARYEAADDQAYDTRSGNSSVSSQRSQMSMTSMGSIAELSRTMCRARQRGASLSDRDPRHNFSRQPSLLPHVDEYRIFLPTRFDSTSIGSMTESRDAGLSISWTDSSSRYRATSNSADGTITSDTVTEREVNKHFEKMKQEGHEESAAPLLYIDPSQLTLPSDKPHGSGSYGEVFIAEIESRQKDAEPFVVAAKFYKMGAIDPSFMKEQRREFAVAKKVKHSPNVLSFIGLVENFPGKGPGIIMEFVSGEPGDEWVYDKTYDEIPLSERLYTLYQVARGLHDLHEAGIVHNDVAARNFMLDRGTIVEGGFPRALVNDFGLAQIYRKKHGRKTIERIHDIFERKRTAFISNRGLLFGEGAWRHQSPESLFGLCSSASDVYMFGLTMFEVLRSGPPFVHVSDVRQKRIVDDYLYPEFEEMDENVPEACTHLIRLCINQDGRLRPTMHQISCYLLKWSGVTPSATDAHLISDEELSLMDIPGAGDLPKEKLVRRETVRRL